MSADSANILVAIAVFYPITVHLALILQIYSIMDSASMLVSLTTISVMVDAIHVKRDVKIAQTLLFAMDASLIITSPISIAARQTVLNSSSDTMECADPAAIHA